MSDYNIQMHEYNGSGYDNLYPKTKSNMVLDGDTNLETKLKYYSNPNLLDNWYFVGGGSQQGGGQFPINQRGETSYPSGTLYCIDRWTLAGSPNNPTMTIQDDGIIVTNVGSEGNYTFMQPLENSFQYIGKTLTFSILGSLVSGTRLNLIAWYHYGTTDWRGDYATTTLDNGCATLTFTVPSDAETIAVMLATIAPYESVSVKLHAAKLELGDCQTIAHQENGAWVLNEIPNFQQELAKCLRYQIGYSSSTIFSSDISYYTENFISFTISFPSRLNKRPAISQNALRLYTKDGSQIDMTGWTFGTNRFSGDKLEILASKQGHGLTKAVLGTRDLPAIFDSNL